MSLVSWKLENGLCRCCHNDGTHRNLGEPCLQQGRQEIFVDMLQNCLNISLSPMPGPLCTVTYTICEDCIQRLQDACNFKQQVIECEQRFHELYDQNIIKLASDCSIDVKQENPDDDDDVKPDLCLNNADDGYDYSHNGSDDNFDTDLDIKQEQTKKSQSKKAKTKEKAKAKPKSHHRKQNAKPKPDSQKEKKGDGPTAPMFRLQDSDFTTEGDVFKCSKCDKPYDKMSSLRYHVKTKHYNIPRFPCPYCPAGFMTPAPLTIHKLEEHNVDDRFNCNACKGTFNTRVQLRKHINNFHMLGEKYKCEFCEYESFSFEGMYKHKFKHKTVKDYHCRFCRKAFLRKTTLDLHERIHTGDRRKVCSVCSKAFVQKASLNYHMAKYHPEVKF